MRTIVSEHLQHNECDVACRVGLPATAEIRSFSGPTIWNSLPHAASSDSSPSLNTFMQKLTTGNDEHNPAPLMGFCDYGAAIQVLRPYTLPIAVIRQSR